MQTIAFLTTLLIVPSTLCITNTNLRRDSYLSAYMESQSTTEMTPGVVYPELVRTYGPPQYKPPVYYGPPSIASAPPVEYPSSGYPLLETMFQLPEKLEFLPKLITAFLGIKKILLKVVLLKLILKFVVMFCLFFFLPKLEMLDMATETEMKPSVAASVNGTTASASASTAPMEDEEEARLNRITGFVMESVENRPFLKKYCHNEEYSLKCKLLTTLMKLQRHAFSSSMFNLSKNFSNTTKEVSKKRKM